MKAKPVGYENDKKWEQLGAQVGLLAFASLSSPSHAPSVLSQIEEEEKNEKPEGDGALNKLFKDIYKNGEFFMRRFFL